MDTNNKRLAVLVDTSGSMREDSKHAVVKYALAALQHWLASDGYRNITCDMFSCTSAMTPVSSLAGLKFDGSFDMAALDTKVLAGYDAILFFSDGFFRPTALPPELVGKFYCVTIGADALSLPLQKLSALPVVLQPGDIKLVLDILKVKS